MADPDIVWLEAQSQVTFVEVARCSGFPEATLRELVEYGALSSQGGMVSAACVGRLREAARLAGDLELDTPSVALVLRFLERIEALESEVRYLHAQVAAPRR
jgi:chaperone modulatory protein CbpM